MRTLIHSLPQARLQRGRGHPQGGGLPLRRLLPDGVQHHPRHLHALTQFLACMALIRPGLLVAQHRPYQARQGQGERKDG